MESNLKPYAAGNERSISQSMDLPIPEAVGMNINHYTGQAPNPSSKVMRINLRKGFDLSVYDIQTELPLEQDASTEACIAINILLKGAGFGVIHSSDSKKFTVPYNTATTYACIMNDKLQTSMNIPPNSRLTGVDIRLSLEFLSHQRALPDMSLLTAMHDWHLGSGSTFWIGATPSSGHALENAEYIVKEAFAKNANDLGIEEKVLSIVSETISMLGAKKNASNDNKILSPRQSRLIEKAHKLLLSDIAHSWTIKELARRTGINEKQLKQGFRSTFGIPIYQFLQNERLAQAKKLLEQGDKKISNVSLSVGYANPSHFAYLFKRRFGISPSKII